MSDCGPEIFHHAYNTHTLNPNQNKKVRFVVVAMTKHCPCGLTTNTVTGGVRLCNATVCVTSSCTLLFCLLLVKTGCSSTTRLSNSAERIGASITFSIVLFAVFTLAVGVIRVMYRLQLYPIVQAFWQEFNFLHVRIVSLFFLLLLVFFVCALGYIVVCVNVTAHLSVPPCFFLVPISLNMFILHQSALVLCKTSKAKMDILVVLVICCKSEKKKKQLNETKTQQFLSGSGYLSVSFCV